MNMRESLLIPPLPDLEPFVCDALAAKKVGTARQTLTFLASKYRVILPECSETFYLNSSVCMIIMKHVIFWQLGISKKGMGMRSSIYSHSLSL